jgi:hypothetical protein
MENGGIFYGHLEYFKAIWYSLLKVANFVVIWYSFPCFGKKSEKNLATLQRRRSAVAERRHLLLEANW